MISTIFISSNVSAFIQSQADAMITALSDNIQLITLSIQLLLAALLIYSFLETKKALSSLFFEAFEVIKSDRPNNGLDLLEGDDFDLYSETMEELFLSKLQVEIPVSPKSLKMNPIKVQPENNKKEIPKQDCGQIKTIYEEEENNNESMALIPYLAPREEVEWFMRWDLTVDELASLSYSQKARRFYVLTTTKESEVIQLNKNVNSNANVLDAQLIQSPEPPEPNTMIKMDLTLEFKHPIIKPMNILSELVAAADRIDINAHQIYLLRRNHELTISFIEKQMSLIKTIKKKKRLTPNGKRSYKQNWLNSNSERSDKKLATKNGKKHSKMAIKNPKKATAKLSPIQLAIILSIII